MNEITAAIIGAALSAVVMMLANISNRRERDIREVFKRLNLIEKDIARLIVSTNIDFTEND
tara:strand:+ start:22 stop:204 length:183 start_codon:yes stop_codon:yes gene_type:complete